MNIPSTKNINKGGFGGNSNPGGTLFGGKCDGLFGLGKGSFNDAPKGMFSGTTGFGTGMMKSLDTFTSKDAGPAAAFATNLNSKAFTTRIG